MLWADAYSDKVLADKPVAYWRFSAAKSPTVKSVVGDLSGQLIQSLPPGPRPLYYPEFSADNKSMAFDATGNFLGVADPGKKSVLDFAKGDSITIEAWVAPKQIVPAGRFMYIAGKGRTYRKGVPQNNQNYALRLVGVKGGSGLSFLFRNAANTTWHRWTSNGLLGAGEWHHVALTYTFGKGSSVLGYIDGQPTDGAWDMGGQTDSAPWTDDDELRIGASQGGASGIPFDGRIDEVAIYRKVLSAERLAGRFKSARREFTLDVDALPAGKVRATLHEGIGENWNYVATDAAAQFDSAVFAFPFLPKKYNAKGLIVDRSSSFLLRAAAKVNLPKGEHRILLRARTSARLWMDGKVVASTKPASRNSNGHQPVPVLPESLGEFTRMLRPGMQEQLVKFTSTGGEQLVLLEAFVGGKSLRPETGELSVAISSDGKSFQLLSPKTRVALTDDGWDAFARAERLRMFAVDRATRANVSQAEAAKWKQRHSIVRATVEGQPKVVATNITNLPSQNAIDDFINLKLSKARREPLALTDDWAFLRRVALDTVGVVPTPEQIAAFQNDKKPGRRARAIDRFLKDNLGWADHWTSYWQDVLAENPNILKPMLNNTGPFRFWIHESLQDNKPMDRFLTELVMMEGSKYYGGPAGFAMATQNDVPMAAKAQVLAQAFLGRQMKCARCHDAPFHDFDQKDLFGIAAMLQQSPLAVPKTSSVPPLPDGRKPRVEVSLKPGSKVPPAWPFAKPLSEPIHANTRAQLAAQITDPANDRFAKVMVNRVWKRYLGWGIVEPVDDWSEAEPSHPLLLDWLARQFVESGYDLKHVARLILNSHTYQRQIDTAAVKPGEAATRFFAGPARRRLTAEQIVDSLFAVSGKAMGVELLTLDVDGRRPVTTFLNLGSPRRAWEFTSLSNERDRPALAIPKAQSVVDTLKNFGWRDARQDAITARDDVPNVLQPAILLNGIIGKRATQLSEDSAFTALALKNIDTKAMIEKLYLRILSRPPTDKEAALFFDHICQTFAFRVLKDAKPATRHVKVHAVSWSNHLHADATRIKLELERLAREGDPPTARLRAPWRESFEDVVFALINSPEFIFVP
tara:strand:+ start:6606 stop:9866 length:3261 start_codon:yes stop_codon:yes gene_type:complete